MAEVVGIAGEQLRKFVARIERLNEEKDALSADIREVFAEAGANGFDTKVLRQVIRLRKVDKAERQEMQAILDLYMEALGDLADMPLGRAALRREGLAAE